MTVHQLSAACVKVQVTAEEYQVYAAREEGMLRLIAQMLSQAERISRIPFSRMPVTAELRSMPDGGLSAYFSVQTVRPQRTHWLAARFPAVCDAAQCCRQLLPLNGEIMQSMLYQDTAGCVLTLKAPRTGSAAVRHILLEYGRPFRLTQIARARLNEYGTVLHAEHAVERLTMKNADT
jgi:hypothetical protein